jgi:hypothetical protein
MTDFSEKIQKLESQLQILTKRVEDLELDLDQPRSEKSQGLLGDGGWEQYKQRLVDYILAKPLQAMGIAIIGTAFLMLLLK